MNASQPHKKKGCLDNLGAPLPIPITSLTGLPAGVGNWSHFDGSLKNGFVFIQDASQSEFLWQNGYFGSGSISSSGLQYRANCDIMSKARYERKSQWKGMEEDSATNSPVVGSEDGASQDESSPSRERTIICIEKGGEEEEENDKSHGVEHMDPYPMSEELTLTLEEAFFLSYTLGALVVTSEAGVQMDIDSMWSAFCQARRDFPVQYAVYHHFRCKGWIVKPGLKFGADWMLYRLGPPFYHAEHLVRVEPVWRNTLEPDQSLTTRKSRIDDISALERLANHVAKNVLLCHVLRPQTLTEGELKEVSCLKELEISESCIHRWTPAIEEKCKSQQTKKS